MEEPFWTIFASYKVPSEKAYCEFEWTRHRLFDKFVADLVFTFCAEKSEATVTKVCTICAVSFSKCLRWMAENVENGHRVL